MQLDIYTIGEGTGDRARLESLAEIFRPTTLSFLDRLDIEPGMACLDVGSGTGDITFELARRVGPNGRVVGVDIDETRVEEARRDAAAFEMSNVEFHVANIRKKTEAPPEFDLVYSRLLIDHVAHPDDVIARMRDTLRPGGVLADE